MNCTNPKAVNYDPLAVTDDGSCVYLHKVAGVCYAFQDLNSTEIQDNSFTLSWSLEGKNWVFFHDYVPDFYFSTREKLYSLKNGSIYEHHAGPVGKYYDPLPKPFFIDVVFSGNGEQTLDTVEWLSEVLDGGVVKREETLTHITIWNSRQCTGRIPVSTAFKDLQFKSARETVGKWSFDDFRDKVKLEGTAFLQDLFHNFAVVGSALSDSIPWFEQQLMEDTYFIVRFEYDNSSGKKIFLHETAAQTTPSYR